MYSWDPKHIVAKEGGVLEELDLILVQLVHPYKMPCGAQIQCQDKLKYCGCTVSPINMKDGMLTHPTDILQIQHCSSS